MILYERSGIVVRDSEPADIQKMKDRMRPMEIAEVWASHHFTPEEALSQSYANSTGRMTMLFYGEVFGMFGFVPESLLGDKAIVWLLTTPTIEKIGLRFLRTSRELFRSAMSRYCCLYNFVDARNIQCLNWLRWCGARIYPPEIRGLEQIPFHYFEFGGK